MAGSTLLSCGVLLFNEHDQLLLAHATGSRHWDVPKGLADPGEAPLAAALRETCEETGIVLDASGWLDLGRHAYRPGKDFPERACTNMLVHTQSATTRSGLPRPPGSSSGSTG